MSIIQGNTNDQRRGGVDRGPEDEGALSGPRGREFACSVRRHIKMAARNLGLRAAGRFASVINTTVGSRAGHDLGILLWHRVSEHVPGLPAPSHNVAPNRFRSQIAGLLRRGAEFRSLGDVLELRASGKAIPRGTAVLTFDDGYGSVYSNAFPVLAELKVPATVFVNTAYLDSEEPLPFDPWGVQYADQAPSASFRPLRTEECREMLDSGWIEFGAHTHTHRDFRGRLDDFSDDMACCLDALETRFGLREPTFAFPFGCWRSGFVSDELLEASRRAGVRCALTTEAVLVDPKGDPFGWGRFNVRPWDTDATLAGKLGGWYSWAPRFWRAAQGSIWGTDAVKRGSRSSESGDSPSVSGSIGS